MWKLTIQDDQGNETRVHLVREDYTIGRSEENSVRLTERNVSRRHARLNLDPSGWHLHDLTSYNGCYVNGARVADPQNLAHGDLIQLGDYRLTVEDEALETSRDHGLLTLPGRSGVNMQADRLVVIAGPGQGQEFLISGERVVLGRGEECEVALNHPSVSRVHAEIRLVADGRYEVVDLESANGVRVNGVELPSSLLDARDVVELGDVILKFLPAGEIYIAGSDETQKPPSVGASLPGWAKLAIGAAVATAVGVLVVIVAFGGGQASHEPLANSGDDGLASILSEAKGRLARGDAQGAMEKAATIPESSNLRQSQDFKTIQAAWADDLFGKAAAASDPTEKRVLLDRVARSTAVDPARRKRAAAELDAMRHAAVNVADLPSEEGISVEPSDPGDAPAAAAAPAAERPPPSSSPKKAQAIAARPAAPVAPVAKPAPTAKPSAKPGQGATLVRQNPFDDP